MSFDFFFLITIIILIRAVSLKLFGLVTKEVSKNFIIFFWSKIYIIVIINYFIGINYKREV